MPFQLIKYNKKNYILIKYENTQIGILNNKVYYLKSGLLYKS